MIYTSHQIANYFIRKSIGSGDELTPMKLIKLTYIAHGWRLGLYDVELLDEAVQAWKYGPVIDSLYSTFKHYGDRQITEMYREGDIMPYPDHTVVPLLDKVWEVYKDFTGIQLSAFTHQPNTPWDIVWNKQGGKTSRAAIIPNDLIKSHYKQKIQRATTNATAN